MKDKAILRLPFRRLPLWAPQTEGGRWGIDELLRAKNANLRSFQRGYQQLSITDDELQFPHFLQAFRWDLRLRDVWHQSWQWRIGGVDLSSEERPGTAIFIIGLTDRMQRVPLHIEFMAGSGPDLVSRLYQLWNLHKVSLWVVENNGIQGNVIQWCNHMHIAMNVLPFTTSTNKVDPQIGLPILDVEFKQGSWIIPWADRPKDGEMAVTEEDKAWLRWKEEMEVYPGGTTTDSVMAAWFAQNGIRFLEINLNAGDNVVTEEQLTADVEPEMPDLGNY